MSGFGSEADRYSCGTQAVLGLNAGSTGTLVAGTHTDPSITQLPSAHLNLRRSPFSEFAEEERKVVAQVNMEFVADVLPNADCALQFVGHRGCGKTTHLLAIRDQISRAAYVHITGTVAETDQEVQLFVRESGSVLPDDISRSDTF